MSNKLDKDKKIEVVAEAIMHMLNEHNCVVTVPYAKLAEATLNALDELV